MSTQKQPIGQRFSHCYLDRSVTLSDKGTFRTRLGAFVVRTLERYAGTRAYIHDNELANMLIREIGVGVPIVGQRYSLSEFFRTAKIEHALDAITVTWQYLTSNLKGYEGGRHISLAANEWHDAVKRIMEEESMAYTVDKECGVHFKVDRQFEHDKASTLDCLNSARYDGVRAAFNDAIRYIDSVPIDTKAAVRSVFEANEILVRLMTPCKNLHRKLAETDLAEIVKTACANDSTAEQSAARIMSSFGDWIDAVHFYRHGQGEHEPVAPPINLAVLLFSTGACFLRWLTEIDKAYNARNQKQSGGGC